MITAQINVHYSLIRELMPYEFELSYNASKVTKNICCAKDERAVDPTTVTRGLKKFRLRRNNLNDRARSGMP